MALYQSEFTQFLEGLKQAHPNIEAEQKKGRALLWDKAPITPVERQRLDASEVAQQAYVYQNKL